ncbi:MAG: AAA family ATPase [Clostridia bacterium]|nr:AAA family ATPase [Clostridia bacterium]
MKKVIVIGCPGSGKSTFSRELQKRTQLPLHYLDMMYWNSDKTMVPKEVFRNRLQEVMQQSSWILDGNYGSTLEMRLSACDTVFFLDYPSEVCLDGIYARKGKSRPDMPWIEEDGEDNEEFLTFISNYRAESRPKVLELLEKHPEKNVIIFHERQEAEAFLNAWA